MRQPSVNRSEPCAQESPEMPYEFYQVDKRPPLAWVYLNRPAKKNAMHPPAWTEPPRLFADLDQDADIRSVILSGKGDCFSSGIDLEAMAAFIPEILSSNQHGEIKWRLLSRIQSLQEAFSAIEQCRKPVIAAIHGNCIGAGLDLAVACDIRLCSTEATFCLKEAALGFVADVGVLQRLPHVSGQGVTRELAFTADTITAERAKAILLVNEVFVDHGALMKGAESLAQRIARNAPLAVQATKNVLNHGIGKSIEDGLRYVAAVSTGIIPSADLMKAVSAFLEKRSEEDGDP
ncbi:MAG: enoyl-CoA hydratase-related protein [Desulfobacterales bacterium]